MKLFDYIKGLRKGKEAHRLEKESMKDPFLADAIDGYNLVDGKHPEHIDKLCKRIRIKSISRNYRHPVAWSIAASLILGVCISSYFLYLKNDLTTIDEVLTTNENIHLTKKTIDTTSTKHIHTTIKQSGDSLQLITKEITKEKTSIVQVRKTSKTVTPSGATIPVKVEESNGTNTRKISDPNIGYDSLTIPMDTNKNVLIAQKENKDELNEVVIVGYASQKKKSLTGSVTTIAPLDKITKSQPVDGIRAFHKYLKKNLIHPTNPECKDIKGEVILYFMVNEQGRPYQISIIKSLCQSADKEAIRLIENGPNWTYSTLPVEIKVKF